MRLWVSFLALSLFFSGGVTLSQSAQAANSNIRIAVLYDAGGRGDGGVNDATAKGLDLAKKKFGLSDLQVREMAPLNTEQDRSARLEFLAKAGYNVVIAVGPAFSKAIISASIHYPEVQFAILGDSSVPQVNVMAVDFSHDQGAFFSGVLAAASTTTGKVGIVSENNYYWESDLASFTSGVKFVNSKVQVLSQSFVVSEKIAPTYDLAPLTNLGVDVIYSTWSKTGDLFNQVVKINSLAAKKKSKTVVKIIGTTPEQYFLTTPALKKILIGEVVKKYDLAIQELISLTLRDQTLNDILNEKDGIYGRLYTVKNGGLTFQQFNSNAKASSLLGVAKSSFTSGKLPTSH